MSELVDKFRNVATHGTEQEKDAAIKVIDEQIEMTMGNVQDAAPNLVGHTEAYRKMWFEKVDTWKGYITDLEDVKRLLKK